MGSSHRRTPPGLGAALRSICDEADEQAEHTSAASSAQPVPRILALHWVRPGEASSLERADGE